MTVYLDTETTGLDDDDEIVELGIADAEGQVLVSTLVRPEHHTEWPEAEAINGTTTACVIAGIHCTSARSNGSIGSNLINPERGDSARLPLTDYQEQDNGITS